MGLFGGLFQKEACCICGGKTGMLDKKTADGKICKDCTKKLSVRKRQQCGFRDGNPFLWQQLEYALDL